MTAAEAEAQNVAEQPATKSPTPRWRRVLRWVLRSVFYGLLILVSVVVVQAWEPMGMRAVGARLTRMMASPQWGGDGFTNEAPVANEGWLMVEGALNKSDYAAPTDPLPVVTVDPALFETPPPSGLRITWLGHSTTLVETGGAIFLTDPVWGERTSPLSWAGPKRWYAPPIALEDLPNLDAILISHDHYDHLDHPSIVWLAEHTSAPFVAPLGVGAHLEYWGVPVDRVIEVDWWERHTLGGVEVACAPSRHASGRQIFDQNQTLWAGYALLTDQHRVFFSGDTGLFDGMREIGERLGPFDVTMLEVGAYDQAWPDWHLGPEQAVVAHQWLQGNVMVPIHWGLFDLAYHGWTEPIERTREAAGEQSVSLAQPRPGESFELTAIPTAQWWPEVPWDDAETHPVRARLVTMP